MGGTLEKCSPALLTIRLAAALKGQMHDLQRSGSKGQQSRLLFQAAKIVESPVKRILQIVEVSYVNLWL